MVKTTSTLVRHLLSNPHVFSIYIKSIVDTLASFQRTSDIPAVISCLSNTQESITKGKVYCFISGVSNARLTDQKRSLVQQLQQILYEKVPLLTKNACESLLVKQMLHDSIFQLSLQRVKQWRCETSCK